MQVMTGDGGLGSNGFNLERTVFELDFKDF